MQTLEQALPNRRSRKPFLLCGGALVLTVATLSLPMFSQAKPKDAESGQSRDPNRLAQVDVSGGDAGAKPKPQRAPDAKASPAAKSAAEPARTGGGKSEAGKSDAGKAGAAQTSGAPGGLAGAAAAGASTSNASYNVSARLMQNGAGTCAGIIDAEAAPSMVGVTDSDTVSQWSNVNPRDKHSASVFIGQRYGQNPAVPFGVTGLIASPNPTGSCDVTSVQVVSSPLPCGKVRETLARGGKVLGELAGIPVIGTGGGQTMLMPTATNTCVLVAFQSKYGG